MNSRQAMTQFFNTDYPFHQEGLTALIAAFEEKELPKHTLLLEEGGYEDRLRFINHGVVREFYRSDKKEINIDFYTKPMFITDFSSFMHHTRTKKNQENITPIQYLELGREKFLQLLQQYSCGTSFIDQVFQKILKHKEVFEYNRMTKAPEELYHELQVYKPHWLQQVPQYHIASYLGITPETLSRIRRRIS